MDRKGAMQVVREAIEAAPNTDNDPETAKFKALAIAALVIAEESLNDFSKLAEAVADLARQPRTITYSGPLSFRIVGNIAETFDPEAEAKNPSLFDK